MDAREPLVIDGATLAGGAAAARLAKAGHAVELVDAGPAGGHWATTTTDVGDVDHLPPVIRLPAAWRDLFRKSGRTLDAELNRAHLELREAPPARHRFDDGFELTLPTERGRQWHAVAEAFSPATADRWLAVNDECDELWQYLRFHGTERPYVALDPLPARRGLRNALSRRRTETRDGAPTTTLHELADRAGYPHLATIVLDHAYLAGTDRLDTAPALLGSRLAVERIFGRWHLADADGPLPASVLVTLLSDRLDLRGVLRVSLPTQAAMLTTQVVPDGRPPALAPTITHTLTDTAPPEGIVETVDHTSRGPIVSWARASRPDGGTLVSRHDHTATRPDPVWGLAPESLDAWRSRPTLRPTPDPHWHASAASHAGNEPWAEILSAALAVYEVHEHLTGADIRPTNKAQ